MTTEKEVDVEIKLTVDLDKLGKVYKAAKKAGFSEVSFEYLVGSCFPKVMENIKAEIRHQYTLGYIDGSKSQENIDIDELQ